MPSFKQSEQEYNANIVTVERKILPSKLAATASNGQLLANWLIKNRVVDGVIDASVSNILDGIIVLDRAGLIDWEIAPVKKPAKPRPEFLQTNDGARQNQPKDAALDIVMAQEKKRREALGDAENGKLMSEAAALVRNHNAYPHSRRIREATALKKELDRLISSKVHPEKVLAGVKALQNTFTGDDVTRPRLGK